MNPFIISHFLIQMIKLAIIRFEGVKDPEDLHVALNNQTISRASLSEELSYHLSPPGNLKISIKSSSQRSFLYSSFPLKLLPSEGFQWIPLSPNQDLLSQFPEDVLDPKMLLMVSNESSCQSSQIDEEACSTCELLKAEKLKIQQELSRVIKEAKVTQDSLTAENEKNKVLVKKFAGMYSEVKKENEFIKGKFEEDHKRAVDLNEKVRSLTLLIEENSAKAKMREEFLEGLLNDREKEYKNAKIGRNENLPPSNSSSGVFCSENTSNSMPLKEVAEKERVGRKILNEIQSNQPCSKDTEIAVKRFMAKTNRKGMFVRDQGNMYKFGKKKVFITLKHGQLLCRVGGGFEAIEEFIVKNLDAKQVVGVVCDKSHKRHKTFDTSGKLEYFEETTNARSTPDIEKLFRARGRPLSSSILDNT
jgi:hypothetical protein